MKEAKKTQIVIDAAGRAMGRVATEAATKLRGKHLVNYNPAVAPDVDVKIINVGELRFTGTKLTVKQYHKFSGYPGGLKTTTLQQEFTKDPVRLMRQAIKHMLPKNRLSDQLIKKLKIFKGEK